MKRLVLCFDRARRYPDPESATNTHRLFHLLSDGPGQISWYHPGASTTAALTRFNPLRCREAAADDARAAIASAYQFLVDRWEPGDRIYLFGVGRGGYCAQSLTRLLSTVGVLPDLMDYVMSAYALPRTQRTAGDWARVTDIAENLEQQRQIPLPVHYLGLWDSVKIPGFTRRTLPAPMPNVEQGRHAVAIDGPSGSRPVSSASDRIEEVWFRGAHCDIAGGPGACRPLSDISLDWVLDGAVEAGLSVSDARGSVPRSVDALAETAHTISPRTVPDHAAVHSSVETYLRQDRRYWKRLPPHISWSDPDWAKRSERVAHKPVREPVGLSAEIPSRTLNWAAV
ncbi:MAG TPA: DUF2235 domain-containing protein [Mycobacterium sp.]|nr:DUF2235 domain-containing protein [Mycobacterium sp.]